MYIYCSDNNKLIERITQTLYKRIKLRYPNAVKQKHSNQQYILTEDYRISLTTYANKIRIYKEDLPSHKTSTFKTIDVNKLDRFSQSDWSEFLDSLYAKLK